MLNQDLLIDLLGEATNMDELVMPYLVPFMLAENPWDKIIRTICDTMPRLQTLWLGQSGNFQHDHCLEPDSLRMLCKRLPALKDLHLSFYLFTDAHIDALAEGLVDNTSIERIELDFCRNVSRHGLYRLTDAVKERGSKTLKEFTINFDDPNYVLDHLKFVENERKWCMEQIRGALAGEAGDGTSTS